jgi:hypothetical protein
VTANLEASFRIEPSPFIKNKMESLLPVADSVFEITLELRSTQRLTSAVR